MGFFTDWATSIGTTFIKCIPRAHAVLLSKSDGTPDLWQSDGSGAAMVNLAAGEGIATETTLSALNNKVTACNTSAIAGAVTTDVASTTHMTAISLSDSAQTNPLKWIVCLTAGTAYLKSNAADTFVQVPMTAGQVLACAVITHVGASSSGTYAGGY